MNIRCSFCQTPYTLGRIAMLDALQEVESKKLAHYDAHCPRCKRATPIPRQRMELFMPNWRDELKEFEAEMKEHPQQEAPLPKPETATVAAMRSTPEPSDQTRHNPAPAAGAGSKKKPAPKPSGKPASKKGAESPSSNSGSAGKKSGAKTTAKKSK